MTSRRRFLAALGAGIGGFGLPGVAQAWGRRWRHGPCYAPPASSCESVEAACASHLDIPTVAPNCLCPQSRAFMNGVYYYGALDCSVTPHTNCGFTSTQPLSVPTTCPTTGTCASAGCIDKNNTGRPMLTAALSCKDIHSHYIHEPDPANPTTQLTTLFDPGAAGNGVFQTDPGSTDPSMGTALVLDSRDASFTIGTDTRYARIWLLAMLPANGSSAQPSILAVGQESKPNNADSLASAPSPTKYHHVLQHNGVCYHVLLHS